MTRCNLSNLISSNNGYLIPLLHSNSGDMTGNEGERERCNKEIEICEGKS